MIARSSVVLPDPERPTSTANSALDGKADILDDVPPPVGDAHILEAHGGEGEWESRLWLLLLHSSRSSVKASNKRRPRGRTTRPTTSPMATARPGRASRPDLPDRRARIVTQRHAHDPLVTLRLDHGDTTPRRFAIGRWRPKDDIFGTDAQSERGPGANVATAEPASISTSLDATGSRNIAVSSMKAASWPLPPGCSCKRTVAPAKFMGGVPTNPATKRLTGWLYSSREVATCCTRPSFITMMVSARLNASSWSWVT